MPNPNSNSRSLKVFLCHSKGDRLPVYNLYQRLVADGIEAWIDEENLLPGQNWREEIPKAVRATDVIILNLSHGSITKPGYIQSEIKLALDTYKEKPPGAIFLIPLKLEEISKEEIPANLHDLQWLNYFEDTERGYEKLMRSLKHDAAQLGITIVPIREAACLAFQTDRKGVQPSI